MSVHENIFGIKVAETGMRYFIMSKSSKNLGQKKIFWLDVSRSLLRILFFIKVGRIPFQSSNELGKKSQTIVILGAFVNKLVPNYY